MDDDLDLDFSDDYYDEESFYNDDRNQNNEYGVRSENGVTKSRPYKTKDYNSPDRPNVYSEGAGYSASVDSTPVVVDREATIRALDEILGLIPEGQAVNFYIDCSYLRPFTEEEQAEIALKELERNNRNYERDLIQFNKLKEKLGL